jgi:hypothetical protein
MLTGRLAASMPICGNSFGRLKYAYAWSARVRVDFVEKLFGWVMGSVPFFWMGLLLKKNDN